jgi:hypothetical protein
MEINDIYDLIPWEVLKGWADLVKFDETSVNPGFPKYRNWSPKAVYADYLMDFIDVSRRRMYPMRISWKSTSYSLTSPGLKKADRMRL